MDSLPVLLPAVWERYGERFRKLDVASWVLAIALLCLMIAALLRLPARLRKVERWLSWVSLGAAVTGAAIAAWRMRWLCDDAFISFRYAKNLVDGHGLVFNPGERVEGYTNFLWTVLMAGFVRLGIHPGQAAIVLGIASYAGCVLLAAHLARALSPRRSPAVVSVAAILLAASPLMANFGTSGLETGFGAMLVLLSLDRAVHRSPLQAGLAGIAAVMTRPDHAIFYVALGAALLIDRPTRRSALRYAIPFFALYLPYFAIRWAYYGDFLPNTFYAKSGGDSYFSQGILYVLLCTLGGGLLGLLPLILPGLYHLRRHLVVRFALLAIPIYLVYIMKIGGDFMYGRLIIPVVPILAVLAEAGARRLVAFRRTPWAIAASVFLLLPLLPVPLFGAAEKQWNLADERTFYPVTSFSPVKVDSPFFQWSDRLIAAFGTGPGTPMLSTGCVGIVGYRTMAPLIDIFGLTDRHVAHSPIAGRTRPGHEKRAATSYLLERGVQLADVEAYPSEYLPFTTLPTDRVALQLLHYDDSVVQKLRAVNPAAVPDFEAHLASYRPPAGQPDRLACDLWFFEEFYFSRHPNDKRAALVTRLAQEGHLPRSLLPFLATSPKEAPPGWTAVHRIRFDGADRQDWLRSGSAFASWPATESPPAQSAVSGGDGAFLDTFTAVEGDSATGRLQSPEFDITGEVSTVLVAGGRELQHLTVSLVVDGQPVASSTGCNMESLSRRVWDTRRWVGRKGRILVVDDTGGGWGHLVVDEFAQWRRQP